MKSFFDPAVYKQTGRSILSLNIAETKKAYNITLLAPGLHRNDICVYAEGRKVTITNKRIRNKNPMQEREFSFSTFTKTFTTLNNIDKHDTKLRYKNDIISVTLIKKKKAVVISPF